MNKRMFHGVADSNRSKAYQFWPFAVTRTVVNMEDHVLIVYMLLLSLPGDWTMGWQVTRPE